MKIVQLAAYDIKQWIDVIGAEVHCLISEEQLKICLLCYKWFYDEYVYQEHVRKVHWSALQFNCDRCARGFWKEKTSDVHVCNPSDFEVNRERRDTQMKKMELLTKLDRPLFVMVNPYEVNELSQG